MAWEENPRICLHMQLIAILSRTGVSYTGGEKAIIFSCQNLTMLSAQARSYCSKSSRVILLSPLCCVIAKIDRLVVIYHEIQSRHSTHEHPGQLCGIYPVHLQIL